MPHTLALITGASRGIGAAFAEALPAETGLLLTGRDEARLAARAERLARPDRTVETRAADLATEAGREAVIDWARQFPVDLLINNAGLGRLGPFGENPAATERAMVEVNVLAPVVITRALLPDMLARARPEARAGVIIVSSVAGFQPVPFMATYAASKAFDLHFAEALAQELSGAPVDVLALCPGATDTDFFDRAGMAMEALSLIATPERVARRALASLGRTTVCLPSTKNRLTSVIGRYLPRGVVVPGAGRMMRGMLDRREG
ncbi:MAG: SDR family NAD(P)-dependent oxidoreductase [Alphaproteobacteria bacterium]|nr:SDR family NAD(P)-dependent oxidoreductase [Alphaproteobacteria bacterium]